MTRSVRPGRQDDLPRLVALYAPYVLETHVTFDLVPPTLEQRQAWYDERFVRGDDVFLAAQLDGAVQALAWSGPFRAKAAYASTAEVSVYVAREHTARGLGSALLGELLRELAARGRHRAVGGMTLPNPGSRALLLRHGFRSVGVFTEVGLKHGRYWDVEWFERALSELSGTRAASAR